MIVLGNIGSTHIKISPTTSNDSEGWFQADVEIKLDNFSGQISAYFQNTDLLSFHSQLVKLDKTLKGKAELQPIEDQFVLSLIGDGMGHINIEGYAYEKPSYGSCLKFEFELDQTYLPELIDSVKQSLV